MNAATTLISVLILVAVCGVVVTQRLGLTKLGYQIGEVESEERRLREQQRQLDNELSEIESRASIERLVREMNIPLVPPEGATSES